MAWDVGDEALHEAVDRVAAVGVVEPQRDEPEGDDVVATLLRPGECSTVPFRVSICVLAF